jgi:hypothetical protein
MKKMFSLIAAGLISVSSPCALNATETEVEIRLSTIELQEIFQIRR